MSRFLAFWLLLAPSGSLAASSQPATPEAQAVQLFEQGDYAQARSALTQLVADPARAEETKGPSRLYLAASLHALNEAAAAFDALKALAVLHADQPIDPVLFLPDFVALAKKASAQAELERRAAEAEARPEPPVAPPPPPVPAAAPPSAVARPVDPARSPAPVTKGLSYAAWGLGAGAFVAGACTGVAATLDRSRVTDATAQSPVTSLTQREAARLSERSASLGRATNALLVAGAVMLAAGAVLWVAGSEVALAPTPNGAVVSGTLP